jgi:hypothetical protein
VGGDYNHLIIVALSLLLLLSFLGVNVLNIAGSFIENVTRALAPITGNVGAALARASGSVIVNTADATADVARFGIDVADGTVGSVGQLLIAAGDRAAGAPNLRTTVESGAAGAKHPVVPDPSPGESPIQKPVSAAKTQWCLAGEFQGKRGCAEVASADMCISGHLFPSQQVCLNPTLAPYN